MSLIVVWILWKVHGVGGALRAVPRGRGRAGLVGGAGGARGLRGAGGAYGVAKLLPGDVGVMVAILAVSGALLRRDGGHRGSCVRSQPSLLEIRERREQTSDFV